MTFDALERGVNLLSFHGYLAEVQKCPEILSRAEMAANDTVFGHYYYSKTAGSRFQKTDS